MSECGVPRIPDEDGSLAPLGSYRNRTIILSLPPELSLRAVSWLALWSHPLQSSFAEISIPRGLNIPPSTRTLGVTPQVTRCTLSFLHCK